jgi:hypothetical protein
MRIWYVSLSLYVRVLRATSNAYSQGTQSNERSSTNGGGLEKGLTCKKKKDAQGVIHKF